MQNGMRLYDEHNLSKHLTDPLKEEVNFDIQAEEALLDDLLAEKVPESSQVTNICNKI